MFTGLWLILSGIFYSLQLQTGSFPKPLTAQEERHYLELAAQGDIQARNILIERNLRLVAHIMKKYYAQTADQEDLISIGTIGLIKAIGTYRRDRNIKLATYASRCIENEVLMFLRHTSKLRHEVSLDEPLRTDWDGNELLLSDVLGTEHDLVSRGIEEDAEKQLLWGALSHLSPREQRIMHMRFGMAGYREMTQKEVADQLGISQSYISRLEKRILNRLHTEMLKVSS